MQSHTAFSNTKQIFKGLVLNRAQAFHLKQTVEEHSITYLWFSQVSVISGIGKQEPGIAEQTAQYRNSQQL